MITAVLTGVMQFVAAAVAKLWGQERQRGDLLELGARRQADELRRRYAAELRRLQELGHEELQREVAREIGPAGVAAGDALLERLRGGGRAGGAAAARLHPRPRTDPGGAGSLHRQ